MMVSGRNRVEGFEGSWLSKDSEFGVRGKRFAVVDGII